MKKQIFILFIFLSFLSFSQKKVKHSFYVYHPFVGSDVLFNDVYKKCYLDAIHPTVLID